MRPLAALLGALAALGGCEPEARTQLVVRVDGDLRAPDDLDALVVRTMARGAPVTTRRIELGAGAGRHALPGSFGVAPAEGDEAARAVTVEIDVMRGSCRRFTYRAEAAFVPGQSTVVPVYLARPCAGPVSADVCAPREVCVGAAGRTCGRDGRCVDARGVADPTPPPRGRTVPTHGAAITIAPDDTRAVVALRRSPHVAVLDLDLTPPAAGARVERRVAVRAVLPFSSAPTAPAPADVDPEGWAAVVSNDGATAWVVLRRAQRVMRVDDLRGTPRFAAASAPTGSEPTGIAISPSGRHLYVTNFADGTVTVIAAATMGVEMTLDLNGPLARSGRLGSVAPRPALAHPRGITISNDGDADDADEVAWVTEFYGQWRDPAEVRVHDDPRDPTHTAPLRPEADAGYWDVARVGVMYRVPLDTHLPDEGLAVIPPVEDAGFDDAVGRRTGCYPNLLYAPHWNGGRVYVTGTCASPAGPVGEACRTGVACTPLSPEDDLDPGNHRTLSHAAIFTLDATTGEALPTTVLTQRFWEMYTGRLPAAVDTPFRGAPGDDARRRMPLLPLGMAFIPGDYVGYVLGYGSDAVFRARFDRQGVLDQVGTQGAAGLGFIDLDPDEARRAHLPAGIAIDHDPAHLETALVVNADTANVSVIDLDNQVVERVVSVLPAGHAETPDAAAVREGRRLFVTGLGRMSWRAQAWSSCETCHPDGLSDGVTWFFGRGPRQSPSLDGSFVVDRERNVHQRLFGWNASFDEVHDVETVIRNISGGVGALVNDPSATARAARVLYQDDRPGGDDASHTATSQVGLNGALADVPSAVPDLARLEAYVRSIRAPRHPAGLDPAAVADGRQTFATACAGCHGSPRWTVSRRFYAPSEAANATRGQLRVARYMAPPLFPGAINPALATGPAAFRYDGPDAANDHMQCAVRDVGTLGDRGAAVALAGVPVREVRQDMRTASLGASGFNPPSLLGLSLSAPYFHAGNARTLEAAFSPTFAVHHNVWCKNCFNPSFEHLADDLRAMASYLLSLDDGDDVETVRVRAPYVDDAADLCAQWAAP